MRKVFAGLRTLRGALVVSLAILAVGASASAVFAATQDDTGINNGLLFSLSAGKGLKADFAKGDAAPSFNDKVSAVQDPKSGPYIRSEGEQVLAWRAPSNIYAQRGTLSFRWRARDPLGAQPFPLFRVSYADHTSWDMVWLRIDWNGNGLDAFVTDNNLARVRVSARMDAIPAPGHWLNIALCWDETQGIRLYVDGKLAARKDAAAVLDSGLDQFGPFSRIISPYQVQSSYQFVRGGDVADIRIFDHALAPKSIAALA
ncbi:MAG TPA: LamG-like jellyroll fold domain-containing protein, partial [Rhizomicrobium sp.]